MSPAAVLQTKIKLLWGYSSRPSGHYLLCCVTSLPRRPVDSIPVSLTFDPCRGGALQPRTRLREGLVPPAPSPERQPGSALWLQQPSERGSLPVHTEPPGGLFHPAAAGTSSPTPHGPNIVSVAVHSSVSERSEPPAYGGCLRTWLKIKVQEKMKRKHLKGYYFLGREE